MPSDREIGYSWRSDSDCNFVWCLNRILFLSAWTCLLEWTVTDSRRWSGYKFFSFDRVSSTPPPTLLLDCSVPMTVLFSAGAFENNERSCHQNDFCLEFWIVERTGWYHCLCISEERHNARPRAPISFWLQHNCNIVSRCCVSVLSSSKVTMDKTLDVQKGFSMLKRFQFQGIIISN